MQQTKCRNFNSNGCKSNHPKTFFDKSFFDKYANVDEVLNDFLSFTRRRGDLVEI